LLLVCFILKIITAMKNIIVDNFIYNLDNEKRQIVEYLRYIILSSAPTIEEKFSYKAPFYYYLGMLCYINVRKKDVDLGLCHGAELSNSNKIINTEKRKVVGVVTFKSYNDIIENQIRELIQEALILNELKFNIKKMK